jgi:hypothetical protein
MAMRLILALLLTVYAIPALAQQGMGTGIPLGQPKEISPEQREKQRQTEEAYKRTIRTIPDAKPVDPWGNMRSVETPPTVRSKPAPKKSTN